MSDNPFDPPKGTTPEDDNHAADLSAGQVAYNIASDTVIGVNVRWSDNKFQAVFVIISVLLAASVGAILAALNPRSGLPWYGGAAMGAFAGLVIGIFSSGIFLMVYRAARHIQGKHD